MNTVTVLAALLADEVEDEGEDTRGLSRKDDVSRAPSGRDEGSGDKKWYCTAYAPGAS